MKRTKRMSTNKPVSLGKGMSIHRPKAVTTSAEGFVRIITSQREAVKRTKYLPAKLGTKKLGRFYVEFN